MNENWPTWNVKATIADPQKNIGLELEFLADTGAFHTAIPKTVGDRLELVSAGEIEITLADRRQVRALISLAYIKLLDRESILPVVMVDVPKPLIGVTTLEGLGLKVDPTSGEIGIFAPLRYCLTVRKVTGQNGGADL